MPPPSPPQQGVLSSCREGAQACSASSKLKWEPNLRIERYGCVYRTFGPDSGVLVCVRARVCVSGAEEPAVCLLAFLLALQVIVQWQPL